METSVCLLAIIGLSVAIDLSLFIYSTGWNAWTLEDDASNLVKCLSLCCFFLTPDSTHHQLIWCVKRG